MTGAGRNIGRAIALALAEAAPRSSSTCAPTRPRRTPSSQEIERAGGKAIAAVADVGDEKAVHAMVESAAKQFGRIDYLVNNAALRQERRSRR